MSNDRSSVLKILRGAARRYVAYSKEPFVSSLLRQRMVEFNRCVPKRDVDVKWSEQEFHSVTAALMNEHHAIFQLYSQQSQEYQDSLIPVHHDKGVLIASDAEDEDAAMYEDITTGNDLPPVGSPVSESSAADPEDVQSSERKVVGRPSLGKAKKLKLVMPDEYWQHIDHLIQRKRVDSFSEYFRELTKKDMEEYHESDSEP